MKKNKILAIPSMTCRVSETPHIHSSKKYPSFLLAPFLRVTLDTLKRTTKCASAWFYLPFSKPWPQNLYCCQKLHAPSKLLEIQYRSKKGDFSKEDRRIGINRMLNKEMKTTSKNSIKMWTNDELCSLVLISKVSST